MLNYDELPRLLRKQIKPLPPERCGRINEIEYYIAFQNVLKCGVNEKQRKTLVSFHTNKCLSAWIFDHDAHKRYAYYPSNKYPLGSTLEYSFFMRQWARNVNRPHVKRLYDRSGDFKTVTANIDENTCPCCYLIAFNILGQVEYGGNSGDSTLCRVTVENELVMWSEFFNKSKQNFVEFNRWFYDVYLGGGGGGGGGSGDNPEATVLTSLRESNSADTTFYDRHRKCETRMLKRKQRQDMRPSDTSDRKGGGRLSTIGKKGAANKSRLSAMRDITSSLLFGEATVPCEKLLVRCEDYTSSLYSPLLRTTSCRHEEASVTYEQRRAGDEIRTEIRTCKRCGAVRAIAN